MTSCKRMMKWPKTITASVVHQLILAEKDIHKAVAVFDAATAEYINGFRHNDRTFTLMISKLVSANHFKSAEELLSRMKDENCNISEDPFLKIFHGYGRVHRPLEAVRVFHKMKDFQCEATPKSYITILAILVEENQVNLALKFYRYMREMGVSPSLASLNLLIKALCKNSGTMDTALKIFTEMPNRGFMPDVYTYGTLINGFCKLGKMDDAQRLFDEMQTKDCTPSVVTYTSLIHGLFQSEDFTEAKRLFEEMVSKGIEPNVYTYTSVMDGFCKNGYSAQAMQLLDIMVSKRHMPNMITYSTLIHGLCREDKIREALEVFDRMKLQGLKPDAGLYGKIISGFCNMSRFREAANFLDEMVLEGISPNKLTRHLHVHIHNMVVEGLSNSNEASRAFHLYVDMQSRGISVYESTFTTLVDCFCNTGNLEVAARTLDEMVFDGYAPGKEIWDALLRKFTDQWEAGEAGAELILQSLTEVHQVKSSETEA